MREPPSLVPEVHNTAIGPWHNPFRQDPRLAGVLIQQFPDDAWESLRFEGKHPAMILFVFWDGRVLQREYSPSGVADPDFWWHIDRQSYIWEQLDYSQGSDPTFQHHSDPRKAGA